MPNRVKQQNSVVEMLAKVPVNRGSLLQSIENLLKTIESSESAVMIPTLLRDKCEFDAWELLFVAKILKASILGHSDLVEFYMNHIGHSSNQFSQPASNGAGLFSASASTTGSYDTSASQQVLLSPSQTTVLMALNRQPASPIASCSPMSLNGLHSAFTELSLQQQQQQTSPMSQRPFGKESPVELDGCLEPAASIVPLANPNQALLDSQNASNGLESPARPPLARLAQPPSLLQLTTTNNHINSVAQAAAVNGAPSSLNGASSISSCSTTSTATNNNNNNNNNNNPNNNNTNHINNNIEQISQQLKLVNGGPPSTDSALSISTATANQQSAGLARTPTASGALGAGRSEASSTLSQHYQQQMPELRTSRSAGCLFRANSGASSPRTPLQTPGGGVYPQAETLAESLAASSKRALAGLAGDPRAPVRLLLQIEQLKASIGHVTSLLEGVVELYKKSIDDIA